jgi:hypothetical protein
MHPTTREVPNLWQLRPSGVATHLLLVLKQFMHASPYGLRLSTRSIEPVMPQMEPVKTRINTQQ